MIKAIKFIEKIWTQLQTIADCLIETSVLQIICESLLILMQCQEVFEYNFYTC